MARNLASRGQNVPKNQIIYRGRGRFQRGRGRFNAMQVTPTGPGGVQLVAQVPTQQMALQNIQNAYSGGKHNAQCYNCNGYGHFYWECPSAPRSSNRGGRQNHGRWNTRGRIGGRGRGRRGGRGGPQQPIGPALVTSGPDAAGQNIHAQPVAPPVPCPNPLGSRQGN